MWGGSERGVKKIKTPFVGKWDGTISTSSLMLYNNKRTCEIACVNGSLWYYTYLLLFCCYKEGINNKHTPHHHHSVIFQDVYFPRECITTIRIRRSPFLKVRMPRLFLTHMSLTEKYSMQPNYFYCCCARSYRSLRAMMAEAVGSRKKSLNKQSRKNN